MTTDSVTLSRDELCRILSIINPSPAEEDQASELHEKSRTRSSTWSNTIQGRIKQDRDARAQAIADTESARQALDEEEARLQLNSRRLVIERANSLLQAESDRMKTFSSAMMLSDVLAEREAQIYLNRQLALLDRLREEKHALDQKHLLREMHIKEEAEKRLLDEKRALVAAEQKQQLQAAIEAKLEVIVADLKDGEAAQKAAEDQAQLDRKLAEQKRASSMHAVKECMKANDYLKTFKTKELQREAREEKRRQEFQAEKDAIAIRIKERQIQVMVDRQTKREKMVALQSEALNAIRAKEELRTMAQVQEKDLEMERKLGEKAEKLEIIKSEVIASRSEQVQEKLKKKQQAKAAEDAVAKLQRDLTEKLKVEEQDELREKRLVNQALKADQKKQIESRLYQRRQEKEADRRVAQRGARAMRKEAAEFEEFAVTKIHEYSKQGKNIAPMILDLVRDTSQ